MRERIDARDRKREVRVVLVGQRQAEGFDPQAKLDRIGIEWRLVGTDQQPGELAGVENWLVDPPGVEALTDEFDGRPQRRADDHLDGLGEQSARDR